MFERLPIFLFKKKSAKFTKKFCQDLGSFNKQVSYIDLAKLVKCHPKVKKVNKNWQFHKFFRQVGDSVAKQSKVFGLLL